MWILPAISAISVCNCYGCITGPRYEAILIIGNYDFFLYVSRLQGKLVSILFWVER